jgi:predicted Fe-Mo cluster-binding NifX family protein
MKIAAPTTGKRIEENFGHARSFTIFTLDEDKNVVETEVFLPPSGCSCHSAVETTMRAKGVDVLLVGSMGRGAAEAMSQLGIRIVRGCAGEPRDALERWLNGEITNQPTFTDLQE